MISGALSLVDEKISRHVGIGFLETPGSWCLFLFEPLGIHELLSHPYMTECPRLTVPMLETDLRLILSGWCAALCCLSVLERTRCHQNSLGCAGCDVKIVIITMLGCAWCLLLKFQSGSQEAGWLTDKQAGGSSVDAASLFSERSDTIVSAGVWGAYIWRDTPVTHGRDALRGPPPTPSGCAFLRNHWFVNSKLF